MQNVPADDLQIIGVHIVEGAGGGIEVPPELQQDEAHLAALGIGVKRIPDV